MQLKLQNDFGSDTPPERMVGYEMEFCPSAMLSGDQNLEQKYEPINFKKLTSHLGELGLVIFPNGFLNNGARFYYDMGTTNEYATPECFPNYIGIALLAGEMLVAKLYERSLADENKIDFRLPLRVANSIGMSCGFHENYFTPELIEPLHSNYLATIAIAKHVLTGQGIYTYDDKKCLTWQISQKLDPKNQAGKKDDINFNKDNQQRSEFRRQDYPILPFTLKYNASFVSALIRLAEQHIVLDDITIKNLGYSAKIVKNDTTLKQPVELYSGRKMPPIHILLNACDKVQRLSDKIKFPDYELDAVVTIRGVLEKLILNDHESIVDKVPWVRKKAIINAHTDRKNRNLTDYELIALDTYLDMSGSVGGAKRLRERGALYCTTDEIKSAMYWPPSPTKARKRADFLRKIPKSKRNDFEPDWDCFKKNNNPLDIPVNTSYFY